MSFKRDRDMKCSENCKGCELIKRFPNEDFSYLDEFDWSTVSPDGERGAHSEWLLVSLWYFLEGKLDLFTDGELKAYILPLHEFTLRHAYIDEAIAAMKEEESEET